MGNKKSHPMEGTVYGLVLGAGLFGLVILLLVVGLVLASKCL